MQQNINLFANKVPLNLNLCPVNIRGIIWEPFVMPPETEPIEENKILNITEGIEVQLLKTIGKIANFTALFSSTTIPHDWGLATFDGNVTGTIKALRDKKADIGIGSFGPTIERRMFCDYSACHMQEALTWCVPKAQKLGRWRNLVQPFQFLTWFAMIIVYITVSIVVWLLSCVKPKDTTVYIKINNNFIYIFSLFIGLSVFETPKKISARISFFVWLIFGLHFTVAYQAKLISVMLKPSYEHQISTIAEVLLSGMQYQILPTHRRFYANEDDWKVAKIIKEWISCHDSDQCLKRVAYQKDFALCTLKAHANFEALKYRDSNGQSLVYCIDYVTYPAEMYMTKGFPLKERIDKLIYRVRDSGLMFKWKSDLEYIYSYKYRNTLPKDSKEQTLTLDHMQGAFTVLFTVLLFSVVMLICELMYQCILQ